MNQHVTPSEATLDLPSLICAVTDSADARAAVWIVDVQDSESVSQLVQHLLGSGTHVWPLRCLQTAMETYSGIQTLLRQLIPIVQREAPELITTYHSALEFVCPQLIDISDPGPSPLSAHAVAFAVVRRISRESLHTAAQIDGTARFILEAHRRCPSLSGPWCLVFQNFDVLDRPSLRIIYRVQRLTVGSDNMRFVAICTSNPLSVTLSGEASQIRASLATTRSHLFQRIAADLRPHIVTLGQGQPLDPADQFLNLPDADSIAIQVAQHLVEQNYERAYLVAEHGLRVTAEPEEQADLYRLIGLVNANVGEYEAARDCIEQAISLATSPLVLAHLYYLLGLLLTKRSYQLEDADTAYCRGLRVLDEVDGLQQPDPEMMNLERAWLMNGRALVAVLQAKKLPAAEQSACLENVLRQEINAFHMVGKSKAPHVVYLRHNLLANIAFVLEILQRYAEAISFWTKAFGQYLGQGQSAQHFEPIYLYRIGILLWKDRQPDAAIEKLQLAWAAATRINDRFLEERILYGLGYIALSQGNTIVASQTFQAGLRIAWDLRELRYCAEHALGTYRAALQAGEAATGDALQESLLKPLSTLLNTSVSELANTPLRPPSPKLPAYLPSVDLEPSPDIDLNRYLVTDPQPAAMQPSAVATGIQ